METVLLHPTSVVLPADRPIRILFLTSIRDVGQCDCNGMYWQGRDANGNYLPNHGYMMGVIEYTYRAVHGGLLHGEFEIVGVITDDRPQDLVSYTAVPPATHDRSWIWQDNLNLPTRNIPSHFRGLPRDAVDERAEQKLAFEREVYNWFRKLGADIIVSDHYMARIEYLISELGLYGRVLNIHPAVTLSGHPCCFRGQTPTADAIARAQTGVEVYTGATLHLVNSVIDDGPIIAYTVGTPVYPGDHPMLLRHRNYQMAKLPLFVEGLRHYRRLVCRL